ncbi:type II secretion system protein GspC [Halorhodospira abdelmalekii]|uniref:type II secretion system protein GspC n=1 Tax=Halorhodospira abdelmalekii TaxID=421629 RepID=UPI00190833D1|nr:type II secretion system protein GspC [Halorhodospira abdelmalekii]MBK1733777.1 type II secretion system protein GspC [Halorhodospira abdelmalekii]
MEAWLERLKALASPEVGGPWVRRLGVVLLAVGVLLIAHSAAETTWQWVAPDEPAGLRAPPPGALGTGVAPQRAAGTPERGREGSDLAAIADYHLFGRPPERREAARPEIPTDAPETRLNLTLRGILAQGGEGRGAAVIESREGQKVFVAGAELPGGAVLERVQPDRVILSRDGQFEMLRLERERLTLSQGVDSVRAARPTDSPVRRGEATVASRTESETAADAQARIGRAELQSLREDFYERPQRIAEMVEVRPVLQGGSIRGFRVSPQDERARRYFARAGLQAGDIVLEVNGVSAANQRQMQQLVGELDSTSSVHLRIERDGVERDVHLRIN